jgi:hypothetical protein
VTKTERGGPGDKPGPSCLTDLSADEHKLLQVLTRALGRKKANAVKYDVTLKQRGSLRGLMDAGFVSRHEKLGDTYRVLHPCHGHGEKTQVNDHLHVDLCARGDAETIPPQAGSRSESAVDAKHRKRSGTSSSRARVRTRATRIRELVQYFEREAKTRLNRIITLDKTGAAALRQSMRVWFDEATAKSTEDETEAHIEAMIDLFFDKVTKRDIAVHMPWRLFLHMKNELTLEVGRRKRQRRSYSADEYHERY